MKRPKLNKIPMKTVLDAIGSPEGCALITMAPKQWDNLLEAAYDAGWFLLEIKNEIPVMVYQKRNPRPDRVAPSRHMP